ncbi:hypothetical protein BJX68DRAFT_269479 [Aspergillus pseudodeflectus]|uniref:EthD domain-containing protein n=1 Tax=Aspergillus pseudodeflectus TaxID=176178 RepID=A0ABR4K1B1_9EURO
MEESATRSLLIPTTFLFLCKPNNVVRPLEGTTVRSLSTPATVLRGTQTDAALDAIAEFSFADQAAFERFVARIQIPEVAADEEGFRETESATIVVIGEACETRG